MDNKTVGQYIREKRLEKNLTQNELGEILYVSDKTISRWETGNTLPDASLLPQLAEILGVTTDEILSAGTRGEKYHNDIHKLTIKKYIMAIVVLVVIIAGYSPFGIDIPVGVQENFWENTDYHPYIMAILICYGTFMIIHKKGDRVLYCLELLCLCGFCGCYSHLYSVLEHISWYRIYPAAMGAFVISAFAVILHGLLLYGQSFAKPDTELWTGKRMRHLLALITVVNAIFIFYPYEQGFGCSFMFAFVYPDSQKWGNVPADSYNGIILTLGWVSVVVNFFLSEAFDNWKKGFCIGYFLTNLHIIISAVSAIFRFNYHSIRIWIVVSLNILQIIVTLLFMHRLDSDNQKWRLTKRAKIIGVVAGLLLITSFGYYIVRSYGIYAESDKVVADYSGQADMSLYNNDWEWKYGENKYGEPVFLKPRSAFDLACTRYKDAIDTIAKNAREEGTYIHYLNYSHFQAYKTLGWQIQTDDERIRKQGIELTKFLDIYENSLKKWIWVWGMGFQRIVPEEKEYGGN